MSDYEAYKVADLKTLLKERGISSAGLSRKAQYVEALLAADEKRAEHAGEDAPTDPAPVADIGNVSDGADELSAGPIESMTTEDEPLAAPTAPQPEVQQPPIDTSQSGQAPDSDRKRKRDDGDAREDTNEASVKKTRTEDTVPDAGVYDTEAADIPSEHAPTAALYIKDLMRPLQIQPFEADLLLLADPSDLEQGGAIVNSHLDSLKTHAFVICSSVSMAVRLRGAIHGKPYPRQERQRKALWVDYIPEDRAREWIEQEQQAGRDARFEVAYDQGEARLIETSSRPSHSDDRASHPGPGVPGAPSGPRGQRQSRREYTPEPAQDEATAPKQTTSFNKLDQYFRFTTAKPKIYFRPVDSELADRRLDELDRETSRDWQNGRAWNRTTRLAPIDQLRRYTFDDGDKVVDGGMDFGGFGRRQGAGGTGGFTQGPPRGGGRGGGGSGRYRP